MPTAREAALSMPRRNKLKYLLNLAEERFRDEVVRPLLLRIGLKGGDDVCGPQEKGKDAIFAQDNFLGTQDLIVVQTKRGNLTLSRKASDNVVTAITQLRTALSTPVPLVASRSSQLPHKVILCASGRINEAARQHIASNLSDPRIEFMDADRIVHLVDQHLPELWLGLDANLLPYVRDLRAALERADEAELLAQLFPGHSSAASDGHFVTLYLSRVVLRPRKRAGQVTAIPEVIETTSSKLLEERDLHFLVVGEPGSGKSTLLRRLAFELATAALDGARSAEIPVLFRATELAQGEDDLLGKLFAEARRITADGHSAFGTRALEAGRVVVLVDALDEVADTGGRTRVVERLLEFAALYPQCRIILTSREYGFLSALPGLGGFAKYRVDQMSLGQAHQLIRNLEAKGRLDVGRSQEIIRRLDQVHGMTLSPMLVAIFAATSDYARRDVPANITELFKKFTELMIGRWDATKGLAQQHHAPLKDHLLKRLAYEMHRHRTTRIAEHLLDELLGTVLRELGREVDIPSIREELVERSGLLRNEAGSVAFRHLLIQEFFAGRHMEDREARALVTDEWWRRAIVFHCGDQPSRIQWLAEALDDVRAEPPKSRYLAALTIGTSIQACYLASIEQRIEHIANVVACLSETASAVVEELGTRHGSPRYSITPFLWYYLEAREAVGAPWFAQGLRSLEEAAAALPRALERDIAEFWICAGLIEGGAAEDALVRVTRYNPDDSRLALALHLGASIAAGGRVAGQEEKRAAQNICRALEPRIRPLLLQVLTEYRSQLLELREGTIQPILDPPGSQPA